MSTLRKWLFGELPLTGTADFGIVAFLAMVIYACTIFLGAGLLFLIQPMIAKALLPWFGGAASVWTVCMLFFQSALLAGYLYAHRLQRLRLRRQLEIHGALLAVSLAVLPVVPGPGWRPGGPEHPSLLLLGALAASVGLPYFLLSTTGPLLQSWLARQGRFPYRLYALSNLASLIGLMAYPFAVEPFAGVRNQLKAWSAAYALFAILCGVAVWLTGVAVQSGESPKESGAAPPWRTRLGWIAFSACSSTLLLAITQQLCQNVAPVPFLFLLPLAIYLGSFTLCFRWEGIYNPPLFRRLLVLSLASLFYAVYNDAPVKNLAILVSLYGGTLLVCVLFCHGELARSKPAPEFLTDFYLCIAVGGALGGLFVGALAPAVFHATHELMIGLAGCMLLALPTLYGLRNRRNLAIASAAVLLVTIVALVRGTPGLILAGRNFYGDLRVVEKGEGADAERRLYHGTITHGVQFLRPPRQEQPTSYYGPLSGVGVALRHLHENQRRIGVIGLGTGTLAAYGLPGDTIRFYEINPLVPRIARTEFSFLRLSPARIEIVPGDARLVMEREAPQRYDVLAVDAFSGDSIPMHLLTREAVRLYFHHLRREGLLAVHVSNLYLDLVPQVARIATSLGKQGIVIESARNEAAKVANATWILLGDRLDLYPEVQAAGQPLPVDQRRPWTDDFSNLLAAVR